MDTGAEIRPVARIRTDFTAKFGLPRQSGIVQDLKGEIIFEKEYREPEAVRGLEEFSRIWVIWGFSGNRSDKGAVNHEQTAADAQGDAASAHELASAQGAASAHEDASVHEAASVQEAAFVHEKSRGRVEKWNATVRPPLLGGNTRVGVFATRSPFRPNGLGLSSLTLERIEFTAEHGPVLHVSGIDMMDGTPIFDIKPYIPAWDAYPDEKGGFTAEHEKKILQVNCPDGFLAALPEEKRGALLAVLAQDPRPSYQKDPARIYGFTFAGFEIRFRVENDILYVENIRKS